MRQNISTQVSIPAVYMRGGSSKALFFHDSDLPPPGPFRDQVLKRAMGTPDPLQIDGMGGTKATTSKIAIIKASENQDTDVEYTFAQVGTSDDYIDYTGNCGNISSAVGVFAIEEGLLRTYREGKRVNKDVRTQEVRIHAIGTNKVLVAHIPIDENGEPLVSGDFQIAGVPGSGAPILMDYRNTIGAALCRGILPTGQAVDSVELGGRLVRVTVCDVANLIIFVRARDLGIELDGSSDSSAAALTADKSLLSNIGEIRGKVAHTLGLCRTPESVDKECPFVPMICLVDSAPPDLSQEAHISARLFLDNMCHESMAGTGAICLAACSKVSESVVNASADKRVFESTEVLNIAHPRGIMPVFVQSEGASEGDAHRMPRFKTLSFVRTARRIIDGSLYIPKDWYKSQACLESNAE